MQENFPDIIVDGHDTTMWQLIVKKGMPPTRMVCYCCDELKEGGGHGRIMVTGVRWAESTKRKNNRGLLELNNYTKKYVKLMNDNDEARRMFETCAMKSMHTLNPIIDWTQEEVREYLHSRNIPYCKLYDEGFDCIGCMRLRAVYRTKSCGRCSTTIPSSSECFSALTATTQARKRRKRSLKNSSNRISNARSSSRSEKTGTRIFYMERRNPPERIYNTHYHLRCDAGNPGSDLRRIPYVQPQRHQIQDRW